ncbi:MAG TPA: hypothetical protein VMG41_11335 [Gemmatimonadales bacterium]|nr:hypothetical protein [Gemmatimonadales bacterium]
MDWERVFFVVFFTLVMPASWMLLAPLARYLRRRATAPEIPAELLEELDQMRSRIAELEDRADFAERLLARQREPGTLPEHAE